MELETTIERPAPAGALDDEEIVARVLGGEKALFEILMRRYNQRLYRVALAILGDDGGERIHRQFGSGGRRRISLFRRLLA